MFWLGFATLGYAAFTASIYFRQRKIIYPSPRPVMEPRAEGASLEVLPVPEVGEVPALYFPAKPGAPTLVHFHGNGEQLAEQASLASALSDVGLGVLAVEYPGYGIASELETTEQANYRTAEVALSHLTARLGVARDTLILQGHSLGTGIATEMATRGHGRGLILIAPYTSMVAMGHRKVPIFPNHWLVKDRYENAKKGHLVKQPTLIIHGTDDEVIPYAMGQAVADAIPPAKLFPVRGGQHNDLFVVCGSTLIRKIAEFARGAISQG